MIFHFFGYSIAHLEPELQPFEDKSIFVGISATRAGFGLDWLDLLPTRPVWPAEIPTNIDLSSNGCSR